MPLVVMFDKSNYDIVIERERSRAKRRPLLAALNRTGVLEKTLWHSLFRKREIVGQEIDHVLSILLWIFFPQLAVSSAFAYPDRLWLARVSI